MSGWQFDGWVVLGYIGQLCFSMRFITQWLLSERAKRSYIPIYFWYFSLCGGSILAIYAFHRKDPVFFLGQCGGLLVYARNLMLIYRERSPG